MRPSTTLFERGGQAHAGFIEGVTVKEEYNIVCRAGFLLQVDCPDLAMGRHIQLADAGLEEFRRQAELHVEALNHALADIPLDRIRLHLCWGNYEGPHHRDG